MNEIRRPLVYGLAVAAGTVIGLVFIGGSSVESGLMGAAGAFVVMFGLRVFE